MVRQYGFFLDSGACTGCKACQMACKDRHDLPGGTLWRRVYEVVGGGWTKDASGLWVPRLAVYNVSMACNHCEEPACAAACPVKTIVKRPDGIVLVEPSRCIGCRYCEWACPYSALKFDLRANVPSKCTFCVEAIDAGERPACVDACPQRALDFGDIDELRARHPGGTDRVPPLPDPADLKPALVIAPHPSVAAPESAAAEVMNWEEV